MMGGRHGHYGQACRLTERSRRLAKFAPEGAPAIGIATGVFPRRGYEHWPVVPRTSETEWSWIMADAEKPDTEPAEATDKAPDITLGDIIGGIKGLADSVALIDSKIDAITTAITALAEAGLAADEDMEDDGEDSEEEAERDISDVEALDLTPPDED